MRALFFVHSLRRGGAERVLLENALGLRSKGHDIEVVSWLDKDDYREDRYASVPRHFLISRHDYRWPWGILKAAARFKKILQAYQPDVIEIHTPTVMWVAAWVSPRIPCVTVIHGYGAITREKSIKNWIIKLIDRMAAKRLGMTCIVPTPSMAGYGARHFSIDPARFICVPNGIDTAHFQFREKTGASPAPVIMMLGTLCPNKGQEQGIKAMVAMLRHFKNAKLMIVGEGIDREKLESLVKTLGLDQAVNIMGDREDICDLMAHADVFWQLSESEGLPTAVLEAMACGLPVVGFDVRGTRDAVVDGQTGCLVPFGDIEGVVQKTVVLLRNASLYSKCVVNARQRVETQFCSESMVRGHERCLDAAVEKPTQFRLKMSVAVKAYLKCFMSFLSESGWQNAFLFLKDYCIVKSMVDRKLSTIKHTYKVDDPGISYQKYLETGYWILETLRRFYALGLHKKGRTLKILDIGTGTGYFPFICRYYGHEAEALDVDDNPMYNDIIAALSVKRYDQRISSFHKLEVDASYDLITGFMVCFNNHGKNDVWGIPEWEYFLNSLREHNLNEGGEIFLSFNAETPQEPINKKLFEYFKRNQAIIRENTVYLKPGCEFTEKR